MASYKEAECDIWDALYDAFLARETAQSFQSTDDATLASQAHDQHEAIASLGESTFRDDPPPSVPGIGWLSDYPMVASHPKSAAAVVITVLATCIGACVACCCCKERKRVAKATRQAVDKAKNEISEIQMQAEMRSAKGTVEGAGLVTHAA